MRTTKLAALVAVPLEGACLCILSLTPRELHGTHALSQELSSLAFTIHIPGSLAMVSFGVLDSVYWLPVLFVSGFAEFWALIAAIIWGWRSCKAHIHTT
ncbi:MAG TPA: hypothetical protein VMT32_06065 [Bryobacteraceae bacterium]|nr:hypothetical protein [Bryobacteraceae bacterium]